MWVQKLLKIFSANIIHAFAIFQDKKNDTLANNFVKF